MPMYNYTIGDLVKLDEHITEQSVVQIDFYTEQQRNLTLLKNFVFARFAPEGMISNLDILYRLRQASLTETRENIFCIIANYGQGKSHLGLVLANYFGRDAGSEEFRVVMDKIAHYDGREDYVRNLREFREERKPYLVLRLRGDSPLPLDQQFLQAMQRALQEAGVDGELPLWYRKAAEWLQSLPQRGMEEEANEFLSEYRVDLPALIERVNQCDEDTCEKVRKLFRHITGVLPDFEGDLEPRDLLRWLVEHHSDRGQRFGGVLILFDEFSQFVERYYLQRRYAGSLQRLLEMIDTLRPRVLFLAFAQHDPSSVARNAMQHASNQQEQEALKELQRIPQGNKLQLHTRMEQVIAGYLAVDDARFADLRRQHPEVGDKLWVAGEWAKAAFGNRSLFDQWTEDQFDQIVRKGCFPLHPLTTAILCQGIATENVQVETARTVLGFVQDRVENKLSEDAVIAGGKPNWVHPIELIDYFKGMLPERKWFQYETALKRIEGEPSSEQTAVLKAILLLALTDISTRRDNFAETVSHLTGMDPANVTRTLRQLAGRFVLYEEEGRYVFPPSGGHPEELEKIKKEIWRQPISDEHVKLVNERFQVTPEVNVTWGHRDDWQARQVIWLVRDFTAEILQREAPLFRKSDKALDLKAKRGLVIRLLALNEEELGGLAERVAEILDRVFPHKNAPAILVVLPTQPMPDLPYWVYWDNYLEQEMPPEDKEKIGEQFVRQEHALTQRQIEEARQRLLKDDVSTPVGTASRLVVPRAYRSVLQNDDPQSVSEALPLLYKQVYRFAPPFFDQYSHSSSNLRLDVKTICIKLADDTVREIVATFGNRPGRDCVQKYLQQQWRILKSNYTIQPPPQGSIVKHAWDLLDQEFSSTKVAKPVRDVLLRLMDPPYGYHFHQLSLLFSAWYGYHQNQKDLEFSIEGKLDSLLSVWELPKVDRSERFIENMVSTHRVAIKRRPPSGCRKLVDTIRSRKEKKEYFSQQEAEDVVSELRLCLEYLKDDEGLRGDIRRAVQMLEEDTDAARRYDRRAEELLKMAQSETNTCSLAEAYSNPRLPDLGIVRPLPSSPSVQEIQNRLMERLRQMVEKICSEAEQLERLEDVSKYEDKLRNIKNDIVKLTNNQELEGRINQAIDYLRAKLVENALISEMQAMDPGAPLRILRRYMKRLDQIRPQCAKLPNAWKLHDIKQSQITKAIQNSENCVRQWRKILATADDRTALEPLQEEMNRCWTHYEGTDEEQQVKQLVEECKQVIALLQRVSEVANSSPHNMAEVEEAKQKLERFRGQSNHPAIHSAVGQGKRRLEEYAQNKKEEALRWLQQMQWKAHNPQGIGDLFNVGQGLLQPPAFLPEEQKLTLESLKAEVQRRIEENVVQILRSHLPQILDVQMLRQLRGEIDQRLRELGG